MTHRRLLPVLAAAVAVFTTACGPRSVRTPGGAGEELIVLLPDPDGGTVGRAVVSSRAGTVDLTRARSSTVVGRDQTTAKVTTISERDVQAVFGDALSALPPQPRHFTLFFQFDSEELTDESRNLVQDVVKLVKERPHSDVVVLGHTDTTGTTVRNFALGLKRANTVRAILIGNGLDRSLVEVTSFGESELLVKTGDGVFEPRNRRVEVTVR